MFCRHSYDAVSNHISTARGTKAFTAGQVRAPRTLRSAEHHHPFTDALEASCLCNLKRCPKPQVDAEVAAYLAAVGGLQGRSLQDVQPHSQEMVMAQWVVASSFLTLEELGPLVEERVKTCDKLQQLFTSRMTPDQRVLACLGYMLEAMEVMSSDSAFPRLLGQMDEAEAKMGQSCGWKLREGCVQLRVLCLGSIRGGGDFIETWGEDPPAAVDYVGHYWATSGCLWQFAFAMLLVQQLTSLTGPPMFTDPAFTPFDKKLITAAGGVVMELDSLEAQASLLKAASPTLFYMPHCLDYLYGLLLEINLQNGTLHNVVVVGNSTRFYANIAEDQSSDFTGSQRALVADLLRRGGCVEFPIPDLGRIHEVGLTTLQVFPRQATPE